MIPTNDSVINAKITGKSLFKGIVAIKIPVVNRAKIVKRRLKTKCLPQTTVVLTMFSQLPIGGTELFLLHGARRLTRITINLER